MEYKMSLASQLSDGQGGLQFTAQAPPGVGRLIRIPFYLETAVAGFDACVPNTAPTAVYHATGGTLSTTSPVMVCSASAANIGVTALLKTPAISWATLRIVGFECSIANGKSPSNGPASIVFQDLQIGGGANLFIHEDFGAANLYLSSNDNFAGLRDYPLLKSPNVAQVSVACTGLAAQTLPSIATSLFQSTLMSCNLVCEILQDDNYGSHIPGPYARKGAMVRRGGSFIS